MYNHTSIFDAISTEQDKNLLLRELEIELSKINDDINSQNIANCLPHFLFRPSHTQMQAEFYHHCRMRGIDCHLEVTTHLGQLDAVIQINNHQVIIEFKVNRDSELKISEQLLKYLNLGLPVVYIEYGQYVERILAFLITEKLENEIYYYDDQHKKLSTWKLK